MNLKNYIKSLLLDPIFRNLQYSVFRQKWNIGITSHSAAVVAGLDGARMQRRALDDLLWMDESRNAFAADPFIALRPGSNDEYFVFFENYLWKKGQGTINLAKFSNQKFGRSELLLDSPFHLSYPYVLYDNGKIYLIPEHSQSRNLSLYKFDEVQENLTSKFTIGNNLNFVDSSIISFKGKYWMFCTKSGENDNSDLYIYYSDGLNMPWRMHAGNPVKSLIRN